MDIRCPNCGTSFKKGNGDNFAKVEGLNGIGYLEPETIRNENKGDKNMVNTNEMTGTQLMEMMKGMSAEDMVAFVNDKFKVDMSKETTEFVRNVDFDLQHITAQTFKLMTYKGGREYQYRWMDKPEFTEKGWTDGFKHNYSYDYTLKYLKTITKRMAKLQKENRKMFEIELHFFNKDVICAAMVHHAKRVERYLLSLPTKNCKGEKYIRVGNKHYCDKLHKNDKPGMLFVKNIGKVFIEPIYAIVEQIKRTDSYSEISNLVGQFLYHKLYWKLDGDPTQCSEWLDAFKGRGAYFTMHNLIRHSGVQLRKLNGRYYGERTVLNKYDSLTYLNERLESDKGHYHSLLGLLKDTIEKSNFDFYALMKEKYGA